MVLNKFPVKFVGRRFSPRERTRPHNVEADSECEEVSFLAEVGLLRVDLGQHVAGAAHVFGERFGAIVG